MKPLTLALMAALAAGLPGISASAQEAKPAPRQAASWPVGDLMGLSDAQLREKLSISPSPHAYLSRIERTSDAEIRILSAHDLDFPGDDCGEEAIISLSLRFAGRMSSAPRFQFTDGKLTAIVDHGGESPGPEAMLGRSCVRVTPGLTPTDRAIYIGLLSPFLLLAAPQITSDASQRSAAKAALDDFRLGQEPPGGLATYLRRLPSAVSVGEADGRQVLTVLFQTPSKIRAAWVVRVLLQDGRVVGFEKDRSNLLTCALLTDGELKCDMPPVRKVRHYMPT